MSSGYVKLLKASSAAMTGVGELAISYSTLVANLAEGQGLSINAQPPIPNPIEPFSYIDWLRLSIPNNTLGPIVQFTMPNQATYRSTGVAVPADDVNITNVSDGGAPARAAAGLDIETRSNRRYVLLEVNYSLENQAGEIVDATFEQIDPGGLNTAYPIQFVLLPPNAWNQP